MKNLVLGCALIVLAAAILNYEPFGETLAARLGVAAILIFGLFLMLREK